MATLLNVDGDDKIVVVRDCSTLNKPSELRITSQSVGTVSQHYRVMCYVDSSGFDLNSSVQVYTQAEFDAEFASGIPDLTGAEVTQIFTAAITLFAIAFGSKMLFRFVWNTRSGRF